MPMERSERASHCAAGPGACASCHPWQAGAVVGGAHDVVDDFHRTFGDESDAVAGLTAIAIGANADNTGANILAYQEDLQLAPAP